VESEEETEPLGPALHFGLGDPIERNRVLDEVTASLFGTPRRSSALDRYVLLGQLGQGGFGQVLRAKDPKLEREVAVKLLRVTSQHPTANERLLTEARSLAALNHPNVVEVFDVGHFDEVPDTLRGSDTPPGPGVFVVMELVEGPTLRGWLAEADRHWRQVLTVMLEAGRGLAAAHDVGIIHRDFKPSNVMLGPDGRARVLDFGLARIVDPALDSQSARTPSGHPIGDLTETGFIMGTPAYMAPELFERGRPSPKSDQYSFCVALWEALTGTRPFDGDTLDELRKDVERQQPRRATIRGVPRSLLAAVARGLHTDPDRRYASVEDLLTALQHSHGRSRRLPALAVAVGVGALGWMSLSSGDTQTDACARQSQRAAKTTAAIASIGGDATASRIVTGARDWQTGWDSAHQEVCTSPSSDVRRHEQRLRCLSNALSDYERLGAALVDSDATARTHAIEAVAALPDPAECSADDLQDEAALHPTLAAALLAQRLGHFDDALQHATSLPEGVDPTTRASALLRIGEIHLANAAYTEVLDPLQQAYFEGQQLHDDGLLTRAAAGLVHAYVKLAKLDEASQWDRHAEASSARLPNDDVSFLSARGKLLAAQGQHAEADTAFERVAALVGESDAHLVLRVRLALDRAQVDVAQQQTDAARARLDAAHTLATERLGPAHPAVGMVLHQRALLAPDLDAQIEQLRHAMAQLSSSAGVTGLFAGIARANLGARLRMRDQTTEAETLLRDALATFVDKLGPTHPTTGDVHHMLGELLLATGRPRESKTHFAANLAAREASYDASDLRVATALNGLGQVHRVLEENALARAKLERAAEIYRNAEGDHGSALSNVLMGLGELMQRDGDFDRARATFERVLELRTSQQGASGSGLAPPLQGLAALAAARDDLSGAVEFQARATAILRTSHTGPVHTLAWSLTDLAEYQLGADQPRDALESASNAMDLYARTEAGRASVPATRFCIVRAQWALGRRRVATREARALLDDLPETAPVRSEVQAWWNRTHP